MFTVSEIQSAAQARLIGGELKGRVSGVSINSRTLRRGDLFVAIRGLNFDGHDFVGDAIKKGAAAVLVSKKILNGGQRRDPGPTVFWVKDTVEALGRLARFHRDRFSIPVIAITGSAGKTTTKDLVAAVLKRKYRVLSNHGTENNFIGVPMTLLRLTRSHQAAVLELGTSRFGEISWLTFVSRPTVAVITNIGESHLQFLKTPALVYREKSALVRDMPPRGTVIVNRDDRFLRRLSREGRGHRYLSIGTDKGADSRAADVRYDHRGRVTFCLNGRQKFTVKSTTPAQVTNVLIAISCGRLFRLSFTEIRKGLQYAKGSSHRHTLIRQGGCWIIDDTYNANPVSFRSALGMLASVKPKGRRILVCGDMLELGKRSAALHREVGAEAATSGVNVILGVGRWTPLLVREALRRNPSIQARIFPGSSHLQKHLNSFCRAGDAVLIKGSRGMKLEDVFRSLSEHLNSRRD